MDAGTFGRMRKGKLSPEGRIDLHGMTLAEAHPALISFILGSRAKGRRFVLVITGKGRVTDDMAPMPARAGRLRHDVPRWLTLPPLAGAVLQVTPAHRRHGGEGALYVYLRG
jgi:DNA-nicking Smr family endonuclease